MNKRDQIMKNRQKIAENVGNASINISIVVGSIIVVAAIQYWIFQSPIVDYTGHLPITIILWVIWLNFMIRIRSKYYKNINHNQNESIN